VNATVAMPDPITEPRAILFHGPDAQLARMAATLEADQIDLRETATLLDVGWIGETPSVLLLTQQLLDSTDDLLGSISLIPETVMIVAANESVTLAAHSDRVFLTLPSSGDVAATMRVLAGAYEVAATKIAAFRADRELKRSRTELAELQRIGMALMTERDPDQLLVQILEQAKRLTHSDAGSLYLVERGEDGEPRLRFKLSQNDSLQNLPFVEFTLPINESSIAGYVASMMEPLLIEDAYQISSDAPYSLNRSFDERFGYRTRSMLVVPMTDHRGAMVGVLQLINSKSDPLAIITSEAAADEFVLPYGRHELDLVQSLAGQAAVSIENAKLAAQVQNLFESFVKAAVTLLHLPSTWPRRWSAAVRECGQARVSRESRSASSAMRPCCTTSARSESVRKCWSRRRSCRRTCTSGSSRVSTSYVELPRRTISGVVPNCYVAARPALRWRTSKLRLKPILPNSTSFRRQFALQTSRRCYPRKALRF
jgi:hypothetical protein